ncbi:PTS sugar transporter subunit IIA [Clostridium akagii]|uniref:PTS sugar transporter subunit IIA n=1 Tax=Clostridium akagii TaxID=91623 RepID=UPI00047EE254|nr:PTS sugar transporter subunit IIA [Clostridium akagii]
MAGGVFKLIKKELIFIEQGKTSTEVFNSVGKKLLKLGLVTENFVDEIIKREREYPTGIDMTVVDEKLPSIAIPHTETEYCKCKNVVIVKLKNGVEFKNMISPEENLIVNMLFIILNNDKENQTGILADIMDYVTIKENLENLVKCNGEDDIYHRLANKNIKSCEKQCS